MANNPPFLSVVVPAFNEENILKINMEKIRKYLDKKHLEFEIIIVDDGSTDNTVLIIEKIKEHDSRVKILKNIVNKGKGYAAKKGMLEAKGKYILLTDADLQIYIEELDKLLYFLRHGFDIVIASRLLPEAKLIGRQSRMRIVARFILSILSRYLIVPGIKDPQCGFKCFSRPAAHKIFVKQSINNFGFDLEILFIANALGYKIKQVPVRWASNKMTKVKLIPDGLEILIDIVKIKTKSIMNKY